ncbi:unnamed protein product [Paramecium sonneborni]|uniref:Uncharacterized protein n=1 Tax=Paramecium sonneborni TaxID=65129 RepID=A0A8S1PVJ0_9CILI|nr:unnamed protein product [Paramecium sonneborni]
MSSNYDALELSNDNNGLCYVSSQEGPTDLNDNEEKRPSFEANDLLFKSQQIRKYDDDLQQQFNEVRDFEQIDQIHEENNNFQDISGEVFENNQFSFQAGPDLFQSEESYLLELTNKEQLKNSKIEVKMPGETKNLPKCFARQLQQFIENSIKYSDDPELKKALDYSQVKQFLKLNPERMGKVKLLEFIGTNMGQMFCQEFFGNCQWNYRLTKESKTNIELCFRHNLSYYLEVIKKKRKLDQN